MIRVAVFFILIVLLIACSQSKTTEEYYEDGTIKFKGAIENGKKNGDLAYFYENGKLKTKEKWKSGILQRVERYYSTGELEVVEKYMDGKVEGPTDYYYSNGKIKYSAIFKNGIRVGKYIVYSPEGKLQEEREYNSEGKLIDYIKIDEQGKRIMDYVKPIIVAKRDTINLNETYDVQIRLANRLSDSLKVLIGPLLENDQLSDTLQTLTSSNHVFSYSTKGAKIGENILSGHINEYFIDEKILKGDTIGIGDTISNTYSFPFVHKYYVLP